MSVGVLPYGDAAALINVPLTSEPTDVDMSASGNLNNVGSAIFDGNGYLSGGGYLRYQGISGLSNITTTGFQISIEIERPWGCQDDATNGSTDGYAPASSEFLLELTATGGSGNSNIALGRFSGSGGMIARIGTTNLARENPFNIVGGSYGDAEPKINSFGKGSYIRYTIAGKPNGANMDISFICDGVLYTQGSIPIADMGTYGGNLYVSARSATDLQDNYYARNFQLALEPVDFQQDRTVLLYGDSMVREHSVSAAPYYDSNQLQNMLRELQSQGVYVDSNNCWLSRKPGVPFNINNTPSLIDDIDADLATVNPTDVVLIGGTNDCNNSLFDENGYKQGIDYCLNAIANHVTTERWANVNVRSFLGDSSFDTGTNQGHRNNTVNPYMVGLLPPLVDAYDLQGDETPPDNFTYIGQSTGLNDLHIAASGANREGIAYAQTLAVISQGQPTLTTPYSIGTNNGPMFAVTFSGSSSAFEAANFLDNRAGWASLLKTNDVLVVTTSSGAKMYTVTVDKEARTIALSTGLVIA